MRTRLSIAVFILLAVNGFTTVAQAVDPAMSKLAPRWLDPGWRRTVAKISVSFEETGLDRRSIEFEYQALDDHGVTAIAQQVFEYNSFSDDLAISDMMTVKADGRAIPIDDRAVRDQPASIDAASPYFDERRVKIVAFPDVETGDRIRGRLTYVARRPAFPGAYVGVWTQPLDAPPGTIDLTIDGPASMPLQVVARDVSHVEDRRGDRVIHHIRLQQDEPKPLLDATDEFDTARRFEISTFKDYAAFAKVMAARNAPMAVPDETVRRMSGEIVGDATDITDKAERIHNWVARNIRYVGIGLEDGGWTSQPATAVLSSRYGDCKAHAILLKALLASQGIEADFVVVNARPRYTLTELAMPDFDHAIVYVPALDLYLDPTASWVAYGSLPSGLYGKPVLDIDRGVLTRIPVLRPDQNQVGTDTSYTLLPDGTRQARSTLSGSGVGASLGRLYAGYLETVDRPQVAARSLKNAELSGTGTFDFPDPRALTKRFLIEAPFAITSAFNLNERAEMHMLALTDPRPSLWAMVSGGIRDKAFPCSSVDSSEIASLDLPKGISAYEMPGDLALDQTFNGYTAYGPVVAHMMVSGRVRVQDRTVHLAVRTTIAFDAPVCPADFYEQINGALAKTGDFDHAAIGVTPKHVSYVTDSSSDSVKAYAAFRADQYASALRFWLSLAEDGKADAQANIGYMYQTGKGLPQDFTEAFRWYLRAAAQGNALAESHLGYLYGEGHGVARNDTQAALWYRRSAVQGFPYSEARLAEMTMAGRGVEKNPAEAMTWFEKAASHDDLYAQRTLGTLYQGKDGVPADYEEAVRWTRVAAVRDDAFAQLGLGILYADGRGVPHDDGIAATWFTKAADKNSAEAQYRLGQCYELGHGVTADQAKAKELYMKAAQQGHAGARDRLDHSDHGTWSRLFGFLSP